MEPIQVRTEQPIAAKGKRGPGRPFTRNDPRINRGGVPSDVRAFHNWMRESFAKVLQEGAEGGLTNGEHIIRTLIQMAKEGDMKAIEYVLDRMGGKPIHSVEVRSESPSFSFMSEADSIRALESVDRIRRMTAERNARMEQTSKTPLPVAGMSPRERATSKNSSTISSTRKQCIHGFAVNAQGATQCFTCSNLGLQVRS